MSSSFFSECCILMWRESRCMQCKDLLLLVTCVQVTGAGFFSVALLPSEAGWSVCVCWQRGPGHSSMFSSFPDLNSLDTSSIPPSSDKPNYLWMLPSVPLGLQSPLVENQCIRVEDFCSSAHLSIGLGSTVTEMGQFGQFKMMG